MPVDHHELSAHVAVDVHVSAPGGPNVPGDVCIVLGFTGGSIKLLKRAYSSPYLAAGLHVVTFATPVPPMSRKVAEKELADVFSSPVWQSLFSEPRKLVIHAMSGGGSIHLTHMLRLQPQLVPLVRCLHFDSVPGYDSVGNRLEFYLTTRLPRDTPRTYTDYLRAYLWATPPTLASNGARFLWSLRKTIGLPLEDADEPMFETSLAPFRIDFPNLAVACFLYSVRDAMMDYRSVEAAMKAMALHIGKRGRAARVRGMKFEGSEHVMHAAKYPMEYWTEVALSLKDAGLAGEAERLRNSAVRMGTTAKM